jgi:hypothetical protein
LKNYTGLEFKLLRLKDERMKTTNDTFEELKVLKMYAWEDIFQQRVSFKFHLFIHLNIILKIKLLIFSS